MNMDESMVMLENHLHASDVLDHSDESVDNSDFREVGQSEESHFENPWLPAEPLFTFVSQQNDGKNLPYKCKLCSAAKKPLSTFKP